MRGKIKDEENEGNSGWMSDSEFQLRLPKHATNLPLPTHRHSGTTDVIVCNLKSLSASS